MTEACIHIANLLYLASFLNRDMLWLRILTCLGLLFGVVFFTQCKTPMYGPIVWHIVFLIINFYQIYRLIQERRKTKLTEARELVTDFAFDDLSRDELVNLLALDIGGNLDKRFDFKSSSRQPLDEHEETLKRVALDRLSRNELLNLLGRRMWRSVRRRFKKKRIKHRGKVSKPSVTPSNGDNPKAITEIQAETKL